MTADANDRAIDPLPLVRELQQESREASRATPPIRELVVRPIDVPRDAMASDRRLIGWPLSTLRRTLLRLLRPFHAEVMQVASANDLTLSSQVGLLQLEVRALTSSVEALRAANAALHESIGESEAGIRRIDSQLSLLPEAFSPTLFSNENMVIADDHGRQTVGFALSQNSPHSAYAHFEQSFRGTHDRVVELLASYVSIFANSSRVIDVGCGRGEFLALLDDSGIPGVGVDIDEGMISVARARDLEVYCQDGVEFLTSHSVEFDALFSSQVVEHLEFEDLVAFLTCAKQHLKPNSTVVLETTNPYSAAGLQAYRCDPTHRTLLFPEVLTVLVRACGFSSASVAFPSPWDSYDAAKRTQPSYAVIART